ncbi:MAG: TlpA family protein disulfide reductase [Anaerovoracaceae bacterium]
MKIRMKMGKNKQIMKDMMKNKGPDFAVYDEEGNKKGLSDYLGKPVIINFWASWCGPCKMEMPDFDKVWVSSATKSNL